MLMNKWKSGSVPIFSCAMGCLFIALSSQAASFDCAKARTKVEYMICDNPELSRLDDELAASYKMVLQDKSKAEEIKQEQKRWLKERNNCLDAGCVKNTYELRMGQLAAPPKKAVAQEKSEPRFRVTEGKGYSVCENYAKFLNSLPDEEAYPICHLTLSSSFPDLKEPDWGEMDIQSHLGLVYEIEKILSPSAHDRPVDTFEHWKAVYEQQIRTGEALPRLRRTHLALLNKAPVETILAYEPDRDVCEKDIKTYGYPLRAMHTWLYLWNRKNGDGARFQDFNAVTIWLTAYFV
ncbi:MAG: hypothetical protein GC139_07755 [Sideroxydans sp.]|nr:hypothetical protein [Sideroxydans sp.]